MKRMIRTEICDMFGIDHPILLAGMGGASTPELAAAVSNAGGLGVMGASSIGPRGLRDWIHRCRDLTDKPFGIDTLLPASVRRGTNLKSMSNGPLPQDLIPEYQEMVAAFLVDQDIPPADDKNIWPEPDGPPLLSKEFFEAQMDVIIDEKVPVYVSGLGNPGPWVDRIHAYGGKVMAVIGAVRHARQVVESGIDAIVAQGHDGGGHNSPIGTMALIPQVVDAVGDRVAVIGAGGITDGRGVAAALMLGAKGAWIGSAFLASEEAGLFDGQKQAIVEATEESTIVSRAVTGKPARMIKSKWTQLWQESGREPLPMPFQTQISRPALFAANFAGRSQDVNPGFAGQGIGMIKAVRPAAEIMAEIVHGLEATLTHQFNELVR
jgi:nitronate monooxygenase